MPKVLIADALSPRAMQIFAKRGVEVDQKIGLSEAEIIQIIGEYDGLAVRSATKVTAAIIEAGSKLRIIGRAGTGIDTVDVQAATGRGIEVMNTPYANTVTTAEFAIALMLSVARLIPQADRSTHQGKWEKTRFSGVELTGKTLGIIGCGNVGAIVADRARGLRMHVIVYDPYLPPDRPAALGIEQVSLNYLLGRSDFITLHTPLTDQTRHILDAKALAKTKLIVEAALKEALESGQVAGAAIDVFEVEPARDSILFGMDNVVVTPHLGASTAEAQENVAIQIAEQMSDFLLEGIAANSVALL
jgi:D-3-phosphoglycerate dehydrogenase